VAQAPGGKTTPGELDEKLVRTYAQPRQQAATVNFHKALKLSWPSLQTIGGRIDTARQNADPVALAHLASELHVAEKVSGKKASITSQALLKESKELAKLRNEVSELKASLQVAKQVQASDDLLSDFQKDIQNAEASAKAQDKAASQPPPSPFNPVAYPVLIENYTEEPISIFMNGKYQLTVQPLQKRFLNFMQMPSPVVLHAYSVQHQWGPRNIYETLPSYSWVLLPPKTANDCD
jgi:hypothetical protein